MYCPNCNHPCGETQRFCIHCGSDLHPEAGPVVIPEPPVKKGSHWVPVLILLILSAIGIGIFFATAGRSSAVIRADMPWFSLKDGELYFDESLYTGGSEITVPDQIKGEQVRSLSDGCFARCTGITSVILPGSLEYIGSSAFADCTALRGIQIPDAVWFIGESAFYGCSALEAVSIPSGMEYIDCDAFDECNKLFYIFYPGSIDQWTLIYDEFINPYTGVFCEEGSFYQGGDPYQ